MTREVSAPIRLALCGLGTVGTQVGRLLTQHRRGIEVVGAASRDVTQLGRPFGEVVGVPSGDAPIVVDSLEPLLAAHPDAVVLSTGSFLEDVIDDIIACAAAGVSVVSPCEELAYPFGRNPAMARRIDEAARAGGSTILGTGVNPGFIFDSLVAAVTGVCWDVTSIRARRVVDVMQFGEVIHRRLGIGSTPEEFDAGRASGAIAGHVGMPESIEMLCERLGVQLDCTVQEEFEPLVAVTPARTRYGRVEIGRIDGFFQRAVGIIDGAEFVRMELLLHLRPQSAGYDPADTVEIDGVHSVDLTLMPGMDSVLATSAQLVNSLPGLLQAKPGLMTVKDLPVAAAWLGDIREEVLR